MSLISLASGASLARGYDYYKDKKVIEWSQVGDGVYHAAVSGSYGAPYDVTIDVQHPRRDSRCTCPHANGTRRICKHMVALYFTIFPQEAEVYYREAVLAMEEAEKEAEYFENSLTRQIHAMSKDELEDALLSLLLDGPQWQMDQFISEYTDLFDDDNDDYEDDPEDDAFLYDDEEDKY